MPELPEVETVRRGLERMRLRAPVVSVWRSRKPFRTGVQWQRRHERLAALVGGEPLRFERRGKHVLWILRATDGAVAMLLHLGMTGRCVVVRHDVPREPHTHVAIRMADGRELRFIDPRRFGGIKVRPCDRLQSEHPLDQLGPEPLEPGFDGAPLEARLGRSARALRDGLLDQRAVAGIGNIYAVEALFVAGLNPLVRCRRLRRPAWDRVAKSVVDVLRASIQRGGTTLRDFVDIDGRRGSNQRALLVYGRVGQRCVRCSMTIAGFSHQGRSGAFCPKCQRSPRGRYVT